VIIGAAGMRVRDLGGEELPKAAAHSLVLEEEDRQGPRTDPPGFSALDFGYQSPARVRWIYQEHLSLRHRARIPDNLVYQSYTRVVGRVLN
jgi:hypothetical protein